MEFRRPARIAYVVDDGTKESLVVYLVNLPDGEVLLLKGSAGLIWQTAADGEKDVSTAVAIATGRPLEEIVLEVEGFLGELVDRGLLERCVEPTEQSTPLQAEEW